MGERLAAAALRRTERVGNGRAGSERGSRYETRRTPESKFARARVRAKLRPRFHLYSPRARRAPATTGGGGPRVFEVTTREPPSPHRPRHGDRHRLFTPAPTSALPGGRASLQNKRNRVLSVIRRPKDTETEPLREKLKRERVWRPNGRAARATRAQQQAAGFASPSRPRLPPPHDTFGPLPHPPPHPRRAPCRSPSPRAPHADPPPCFRARATCLRLFAIRRLIRTIRTTCLREATRAPACECHVRLLPRMRRAPRPPSPGAGRRTLRRRKGRQGSTRRPGDAAGSRRRR